MVCQNISTRAIMHMQTRNGDTGARDTDNRTGTNTNADTHTNADIYAETVTYARTNTEKKAPK